MCIQRKKAKDMGIDFKVKYLNISDYPSNTKDGYYSPLLYSDEQRIMQVLLNL